MNTEKISKPYVKDTEITFKDNWICLTNTVKISKTYEKDKEKTLKIAVADNEIMFHQKEFLHTQRYVHLYLWMLKKRFLQKKTISDSILVVY